jgi:hypothetical protein
VKSLLNGKFKTHPGIKLYGELGERRKATEVELKRLNRRMRATKGLKGNRYLWGNMPYVREIIFSKAENINLGKMTSQLS